jgi:flagellar secretion chaperone FliS
MYLSVRSRASSAYNQVAVNARATVATPHELIVMLYDGLLETIAVARGAIERGDNALKGKSITKAVRLLDEGLRSALSPAGGELTVNLDAVYSYCIRRLTEANLHNDAAALEEVSQLIAPIAESWNAIAPEQGQGN